jgi:ketosteroid isomerase-like protein
MKFSRSCYAMLLALPLAFAACGGEPEAEAAPVLPPMSEAGADAMRNAFVDAYMRNNPAGAAAFYAENAVMYNADGTTVNGRAAIQEAFTAMRAAGMDSLSIVKTSFEASGDGAVEHGTGVMRTLDPQTKEASYSNWGYVVTFARQPDGGFQIVKDSTFATAAPAPAR